MRSRLNSLLDALLPVLATFAALGIGAIMLLILRVNPFEAYGALWEGAFGSTNAMAETLVNGGSIVACAISCNQLRVAGGVGWAIFTLMLPCAA